MANQRKVPPAEPGIDAGVIRELAKLLDETGLSEIEIEHNGRRVKVVRNSAHHQAPPPPLPGPELPRDPAEITGPVTDLAQHPGAVTSPMVGTAYLAPEPGAAPFVRVGDEVAKDDTLLIIEAMKTMNPIPAPRAGRVKEVLVANGVPVEFGQPLVIIE